MKNLEEKLTNVMVIKQRSKIAEGVFIINKIIIWSQVNIVVFEHYFYLVLT
jgi:hypothetical protein